MPWLFMLCGLLLCASEHATAQVRLPDLGDPSDAVRSGRNEHWLGQAAWFEMHQANLILDDPLAQAYLESVGERLLKPTSDHPEHYTWFWLNNPSINAFAMPGRFVGFHSGLLLASQSEDEFASVFAHELAHVRQKHLSRIVQKGANSQWTSFLGMMVAGLVSAQNPMVGTGIMAATVANHAQNILNYTRIHEEEADQAGHELLVHSGFDPAGMASFFHHLMHQSRHGERGMPQYLYTHPFTEHRLLNAQMRAKKWQELFGTPEQASTLDFALIQEHVRALLFPNEEEALTYYTHLAHPSAAETFGHISALLRADQPQQALLQAQVLDREHPNHPMITWLLGQCLKQNGHTQDALDLIADTSEAQHFTPLVLLHAEVLLEQHQASQAIRVLCQHHNQHPGRSSAHLYHLLSRAELAAAHEHKAHLYYAAYRKEMGAWLEAQWLLDRIASEITDQEEVIILEELTDSLNHVLSNPYLALQHRSRSH